MNAHPSKIYHDLFLLLESIMHMPEEDQQGLLKDLTTKLAKEKRKHVRKPLFLAIDYAIAGRAYKDFVQNISAGGVFIETRMFVQTRMPFSEGDDVSMIFPLPSRGKHVKVFGQLVRTSPQGVGIKFKLTDHSDMRLELYGLKSIHEFFLGNTNEVIKMAKVKRKKVRWNQSTSPDVTGYKLYWALGGGVSYESDFAEVGNVTEIILPDDVLSFPLISGDLELGVAAVNHLGNESDISKFSATFNFAAPDAPTNLVVEDM